MLIALQARFTVAKDATDKSRIALNHYIKETNKIEKCEDFAGFSASCVSSIAAYVLWVEDGIRYSQSLIVDYNTLVSPKEIRFAHRSSIGNF